MSKKVETKEEYHAKMMASISMYDSMPISTDSLECLEQMKKNLAKQSKELFIRESYIMKRGGPRMNSYYEQIENQRSIGRIAQCMRIVQAKINSCNYK